MKVVYFSHSDGKYGAPKSLIDLVITMKDNFGILPVIITSKKNELNALCDKLGIENYSVYYADCMYRYAKKRSLIRVIHDFRVYWKMKWRHFYINKKAIAEIESKVDFNNVDIIHSNVSTIDIGSIIAKKYNKPHVWHIREYSDNNYINKPFVKNFTDYITKNSDAVIFISNYVKTIWTEIGVDEKNSHVIYDVVEKPEYRKKSENTKVKILFSGSSTPIKGIFDLLEATKILADQKLHDFSVHIYGDYSNIYGKKIQEYVSDNALEDIIKFHGFDSELKNKISTYDIGVVCSRIESFGRVTIEYMQAGLYLLCSNIGTNIELLGTEYDSLMYELNNPKNLAEKLSYAMCNIDYRDSMRIALQDYAIQKFDSNKSATQVLKVYETIVSKHGKGYDIR